MDTTVMNSKNSTTSNLVTLLLKLTNRKKLEKK